MNHGTSDESMNAAERPIHSTYSPAARAFAAVAAVRLQGASGRSAGRSPSDFDLNPDVVPQADVSLTPAAVLIPVVARDTLTVLLTQRTDTLSRHAGQIAFPGGRIDATDADATAAALREAEEEIGLDPGLVAPLGFLETYRTGTGFAICPLVALVAPQFTLRLQADEVADAFEVPLDFLMNAANHQTHARVWQGAERRFYAIPFENRYIWGATAGILKTMHERLFAP
jgi:8-oxo-dGTP pyrophosphatase MutT (NUDIX family)